MEPTSKQAFGTEDWKFFLPSSFQTSVDIWKSWEKRGQNEGLYGFFSVGDTFYDSSAGYLTWSEAVKRFTFMVSVNSVIGDKVTASLFRSTGDGIEKLREFAGFAHELVKILRVGVA